MTDAERDSAADSSSASADALRPRSIAVLTTGRQDWGILRSLCVKLRTDDSFSLTLLAGGMHTCDRFGRTVTQLYEEGFSPVELAPWLSTSTAHDGERETGRNAREAAGALAAVSNALSEHRPDALVLVGDRYETASAALAATLLRIPMIHLHGGEETLGAIDDVLRHSISKMAHLHFVSHPAHARRLVAMGEDPNTVFCVGAPGLDNLHRADLPGRRELSARLGLHLAPPVVVVTMHPATLIQEPEAEAVAVCEAMDAIDATYVVTLPNADGGGELIRRIMRQASRSPGRVAVDALGERGYWGMMRIADAMLGNSSSALIEAPALRLPAVNVGARQEGRLRAPSVIDAPAEAASIGAALAQALRPTFRASLPASCSPFGNGNAAELMVEVLRQWAPPNPPVKRGASVAYARPVEASEVASTKQVGS